MAELRWIKKIYGDGRHNAFTDLVKWRGRYYVSFRNASRHGWTKDGKVFIFTSLDLENWVKAAEISSDEKDDRDGKLVATEGRLFSYIITATPDGSREIQSNVSFTEDGKTWSEPKACYEPSWVFWRPKIFEARFYAAAYHYRPIDKVDLLSSKDGLYYQYVSTIMEGSRANETSLQFFPDGRLLAIVRTEEEPGHPRLGFSQPPYKRWRLKELPFKFQGPAVTMAEGKVFVCGRKRPEERYIKTALWLYQDEDLKELLTFPSGGDTSYAGMLYQGQGKLYISYYEGTKTNASIYLALLDISRDL